MNWYIGQPIVSIGDHSQGLFKKGQEFTISGLRLCGCGAVKMFIGITTHYDEAICKCGRLRINDSYFDETRFAALDQDISELTEILEQSNSIQNV